MIGVLSVTPPIHDLTQTYVDHKQSASEFSVYDRTREDYKTLELIEEYLLRKYV